MLRMDLMRIIDTCFDGKYMKKFGAMSCEMIASKVLKHLINKYGERNWKVSVFEDDIQGGIIEN